MTTTQFREGACLMKANLLKEGDRIVFEMGPNFDLVAVEVETDRIGNIRVRHGVMTDASTSFHPGELLWVIRGGAS